MSQLWLNEPQLGINRVTRSFHFTQPSKGGDHVEYGIGGQSLQMKVGLRVLLIYI